MTDYRGLCYFETMNGLVAYGSGYLSEANKHSEVFELTCSSSIPLLDEPSMFVKKFYCSGELAHLIGIVLKREDAFGRDGFWGVAIMLDDDKELTEETWSDFKKHARYVLSINEKNRINELDSILKRGSIKNPNNKLSLAQYERNDQLLYSTGSEILDGSASIRNRPINLIKIAPRKYSTIILQNKDNAVQRPSRNLDDTKQYEDVKDEFEEQNKYEGLPIYRKFMDRTEKLKGIMGTSRPESVDAEFENYIISLIKYVEEEVKQKKNNSTSSKKNKNFLKKIIDR